MKLYSNHFSPNCRKVHTVLAHTELQLERAHVDVMKGEQKQPEFLAFNPNGKVPVLVDGSMKLWESNAIASYLAGKADSDLWPKSEKRYDIMRWCYWEANHFNPPIAKILGQKVFNRDNPNQAIIDEGIKGFRSMAAILNGHLESSPYLVGDTLTLADIVVGVWLGYEQLCALPLSEYGHVQRWYGRLASLPAWKEALPPPMG
jgi:glutathione S-transferase